MDPRLAPENFWPRLTELLGRVPQEETVPPPNARAGAVLVLLEETATGPRVILTRRRRDLRSHPGQVSFPGGRIDEGETVEQAAVREAEEEIGLKPDSVEIAGRGQRFYIPPSRFWVVPVIARWTQPHSLRENPWEVEQILTVPLSDLCDPARQRRVELSLHGASWAWQLEDDVLWGATARVMWSLLDVAVDGWSHGRAPGDLPDSAVVQPWQGGAYWHRRTILEGDVPSIEQEDVPHVTATQLRSARSWLESRGVGPLHRAEQAARAVTHATQRVRGVALSDIRVTVMAGPSSNGSVGLATARLLASAGADVEVLTVGPPRAPEQTHVLRDAGVAVFAMESDIVPDSLHPGDVVIDTMLGIGAQPPLRALPGVVAEWLRGYDSKIVSVDLPSGIAADDGIRGTCVTTDVTIATGLPTVALQQPTVQPYIGDVYLADLGIPPAAWRAQSVNPPSTLFADGPLVRLTAATGSDAATPDQTA